MFNRSKKPSPAVIRLLEEKLYELVVCELAEGKRRDGLWAKALADSDGIIQRAKALYLRYRVQSIIDEWEISQNIPNELPPGTKQAVKLKTKDPNYILCSACRFEQWIGYQKCQKCGAVFKS